MAVPLYVSRNDKKSDMRELMTKAKAMEMRPHRSSPLPHCETASE